MPAKKLIVSPRPQGGEGFHFRTLTGLALTLVLYSGVALAQTTTANEPASAPVAQTTVESPSAAHGAPPVVNQTAEQPAAVAPTGDRVAQPVASPAPEAPAAQTDAAPAAPAPATAQEAQPQAAAPAAAQPATVTETPAPAVSTPAPVESAPAAQPVAAEEPAATPTDFITQMFSPQNRSDIPHDLSPWGMFMAADWVVKTVMLGLAFASLVTWTVWVAKSIELTGARARAGSTLKVIRRSRTLREATDLAARKGGPAALMLRIATEEVELSGPALDHADGSGVKERVASALSRVETAAGRRMSRGTGVLASIGSVSPFVGLFGTVWGIMNSFISISESQTTNLAVVAPGIAEALLATAIGLVAAIPAVVIYNVFARSITGYRHLLADAASGVERLVSRDLDFRKIPQDVSKPAVSVVAR